MIINSMWLIELQALCLLWRCSFVNLNRKIISKNMLINLQINYIIVIEVCSIFYNYPFKWPQQPTYLPLVNSLFSFASRSAFNIPFISRAFTGRTFNSHRVIASNSFVDIHTREDKRSNQDTASHFSVIFLHNIFLILVIKSGREPSLINNIF